MPGRFVVVGGGVHGLSTAGALARGGAEVIVLEKGAVGAGASGIAGGIVRNYYRSEAMTVLETITSSRVRIVAP